MEDGLSAESSTKEAPATAFVFEVVCGSFSVQRPGKGLPAGQLHERRTPAGGHRILHQTALSDGATQVRFRRTKWTFTNPEFVASALQTFPFAATAHQNPMLSRLQLENRQFFWYFAPMAVTFPRTPNANMASHAGLRNQLAEHDIPS